MFYKVNWKAKYDLLYVFQTNFDVMYRLWDATFTGNLKSTLYRCFIESFVRFGPFPIIVDIIQ